MPGLSRFGNWNENNLNPLSRINWRASLVPAAAVIPAPIAYINVVAVKKLVVGFLVGAFGRLRKGSCTGNSGHPQGDRHWYSFIGVGTPVVYCEQIRVFKARCT